MIMHQLDGRIRKILQVISEYKDKQTCLIENIEIAPRGSSEFTEFRNGGYWASEEGENWYDFRLDVTVPASFTGQVRLCEETGMDGWEAVLSQFVVWVDGSIVQAFDTKHLSVVLQEKAVPGTVFHVFLQGYHKTAGNAAGLMVPRLKLFLADRMTDVDGLYYDINVPYSAALISEDGSREKEHTLYTLSEAIDLLDLRKPFSPRFHAGIAAAREYLKVNYYDKLAQKNPESIADCIGHTHIDVAWLWDIAQTRHKAVRTFSTMLCLMQRYPEFKFMSSQAQLYEFVKEDQPELFERIREAVREGRWEAEGAMWVEADCNLSGGEALIRQILYGNEFFETEFGKRSRILWLPDAFGYNAALPQIMKKCGIDYFMSSKLSWSEYNMMPYDTFKWKGLDGSEVLTHFVSARKYEPVSSGAFSTVYNAKLQPDEIRGGWQRFQQKGLDNHFLVSYGFGDGGGGTTEWMIENAKRMQYPVCGCPVVRHTFAGEFFEQLEKRVALNPKLPKWSGELYLEGHRGTFTSQAKNKKNNRKLEYALRSAEYWLVRSGESYPQEQLKSIWRSMLTLQFHDILPGSAIHKVYTDSDAEYTRLFEQTDYLKRRAMNKVCGGMAGDILFANTLGETRNDIVWFDGPDGICALRDTEGKIFPVQKVGDRYAVYVTGLEPFSEKTYTFQYGPGYSSGEITIDGAGFSTPFFEGRFDENLSISSLIDKEEGRELVKPGKALNTLVYYENRPHKYDAWEICTYYNEHAWQADEVESARVIAAGPVLAVMRVTLKFNDSTVTEDIILYKDIKRIDFKASVNWNEPHGLLKAHFPVDIFYNQAQYDIQFGNITRNTHKNTSWDRAKFEVCAHKWADVSESDYGAALLNDCKYGYSMDEESMALSLIKSSTHPDAAADIGFHEFTYAFVPHTGDWKTDHIPQKAYEFNIPVEVMKLDGHGSRTPQAGFISTDKRNIIVETVKGALHGEGVIVRLYECFGMRTRTAISFGGKLNRLTVTNMIEDDLYAAELDDNVFHYEFKPYEILTIRIQ